MSSEPTVLAERYVLESPVARGGMATVWRARDDVLARIVAVKMLHAHLAEDKAFLERFRMEALAAARLTHPNIVSIYDTGTEHAGEEGESHYIVMEFCSEGSLAELLAAEGSLEPERVRSIGAAVADALGYAHRTGVIHRDIKPANVLVTSDGSLKVADFGIAKAAFGIGDMTTTGSILGTVTYLSPEQLRGGEPDSRSDIYSLGVMLYELLAGRPPFSAENQMAVAMKHLHEDPPTLRSVKAGIPRDLEAPVMKALAKEPEGRFATAEDMRGALDGGRVATGPTSVLRAQGPAQGRNITPPETHRAATAARPIAPVLILIALAVVAAIVITALLGGGGGGLAGDGGGGDEPGAGGARALQVDAVADLDPAGDGEHPDEVDLAADGDRDTTWSTSSYSSPLSAIGKEGVGLVFDLGDEARVSGVRVDGCTGCALEIRASDETSTTDPSGFQAVDDTASAAASQSFSFTPRTNRYWLVFITSLPGGGGGSAQISEVRFVGP